MQCARCGHIKKRHRLLSGKCRVKPAGHCASFVYPEVSTYDDVYSGTY